MNMHLDIKRGEEARKPRSDIRPNPRPNQRMSILHEVVVGILWMSLDPPADASRQEMEDFAQGLVAHILGGACPAAVESEIALLQSRQFCRPISPIAISELARRISEIARAY